jgi:ABC-type phosphate transport system substrate-binding protein
VKKNIIAPVALAAAGLLLLSACAGAAEETTESNSGLSGTVLLDGSSTVGPFARLLLSSS